MSASSGCGVGQKPAAQIGGVQGRCSGQTSSRHAGSAYGSGSRAASGPWRFETWPTMHVTVQVRSPRAACLREPLSLRESTALADDAADWSRGQVKRGRGTGSGAVPSSPGEPCQVREEAGDAQQGDPETPTGDGTSGALQGHCSSEGSANRLDDPWSTDHQRLGSIRLIRKNDDVPAYTG